MNWDASGAIAESLGAIGVIASLVALTIQLRQFSRSMNASAETEANDRYVSILRLFTEDPTMMETWSAAGLGSRESFLEETAGGSLGEPMDPQHTTRFTSLVAESLHHAQAVHRLYLKGVVERDTWEMWKGAMKRMLRTRVAYVWWWDCWDYFGHAFAAEVNHWFDDDPQWPWEGDPGPRFVEIVNNVHRFHRKPLRTALPASEGDTA